MSQIASEKGSKKCAATGGLGFAQFDNGKPASEGVLKVSFTCQQAIKSRDLVFTHYVP
jgi:hypothetical protein